MKKLITFALSLLMTISLCATLTADENTSTSSSLAFDRVAVGNLSSGYTVGVTVPTYTDGDTIKPYKVYEITFKGNDESASIQQPSSAEGGQFTTRDSYPLKYIANDNATVEQVERDLSSITYKGEGTITISVMKDTDTVYYNGHYYKKFTSEKVTWQAAMFEMLKGDTESYKGYKGHPLTITSVGENELIKTFLDRKNDPRIWLGGITDTATKGNSYTNGVLNEVPGGDGTKATKGQGTGYKWIWGTPEGDSNNQDKNVLPDEPDNTSDSTGSSNSAATGNVESNKTTYWGENEPNAGKDDDQTGYVIYMDWGGHWDDLNLGCLKGDWKDAYYVTEYSPIDADGNWLYDEEGNSATTGFSNPQIVSKTITANDVYKHNNFDTNWSYDGTYHWHKCLEEDCTEIIDKSEHLGGSATCISKAICETCGQEYGELDLNNHSNLIHVEATDPLETGYGNIEYWYCKGCNKYFSDKDATKQISKDSTLIIKSFDSKDKNHDRVISCDEEMNSANWVWSETKKACVYRVSNTSTK